MDADHAYIRVFIRLDERHLIFLFFFFNDTATTEIYTLSLHDALPIYRASRGTAAARAAAVRRSGRSLPALRSERSEEHTSELQSQSNLVCRLLLEKKKKKAPYTLMIIQTSSSSPTKCRIAAVRNATTA